MTILNCPDYFLREGYPTDVFDNIIIGKFIHNEFTGLSNWILILTNDAILVLNKENTLDVKKVFERFEIKNQNWFD